MAFDIIVIICLAQNIVFQIACAYRILEIEEQLKKKSNVD